MQQVPHVLQKLPFLKDDRMSLRISLLRGSVTKKPSFRSETLVKHHISTRQSSDSMTDVLQQGLLGAPCATASNLFSKNAPAGLQEASSRHKRVLQSQL